MARFARIDLQGSRTEPLSCESHFRALTRGGSQIWGDSRESLESYENWIFLQIAGPSKVWGRKIGGVVGLCPDQDSSTPKVLPKTSSCSSRPLWAQRGFRLGRQQDRAQRTVNGRVEKLWQGVSGIICPSAFPVSLSFLPNLRPIPVMRPVFILLRFPIFNGMSVGLGFRNPEFHRLSLLTLKWPFLGPQNTTFWGSVNKLVWPHCKGFNKVLPLVRLLPAYVLHPRRGECQCPTERESHPIPCLLWLDNLRAGQLKSMEEVPSRTLLTRLAPSNSPAGLFERSWDRRAYRFPGQGGDHVHCLFESSPGQIWRQAMFAADDGSKRCARNPMHRVFAQNRNNSMWNWFWCLPTTSETETGFSYCWSKSWAQVLVARGPKTETWSSQSTPRNLA